MLHKGRCHCGSIRFEFAGPDIERGLRCNCSICIRKGAVMTAFTVTPEDMRIDVTDDALGSYAFGSGVAKHHFCRVCGIYPFHQTLRLPGHYRVNTGCLEAIDSMTLPFDVFDGASL